MLRARLRLWRAQLARTPGDRFTAGVVAGLEARIHAESVTRAPEAVKHEKTACEADTRRVTA